MNTSSPKSRNGEPVILAFENVPFVLMLGDSINAVGWQGPRIDHRQRILIEAKMDEAEKCGVPLVVVLWPSSAKLSRLSADPLSQIEVKGEDK